MHDTEVAASNAPTLAQAVTAVAAEIARTGIDVASITVNRSYSRAAVSVSVQATSAEDRRALVGLFPGLPVKPRIYGDEQCVNAMHEGLWTGMDIVLDIYSPVALVEVAR